MSRPAASSAILWDIASPKRLDTGAEHEVAPYVLWTARHETRATVADGHPGSQLTVRTAAATYHERMS